MSANMWGNIWHFPFDTMENEEIVTKIDTYLDSIEQELTKPFCLCRDTYNNIKNHIDFKGLVEQSN